MKIEVVLPSHLGAKPELREPSRVKKEVVSPSPVNEMQTSKHMMETPPLRKEKLESQVQLKRVDSGLIGVIRTITSAQNQSRGKGMSY